MQSAWSSTARSLFTDKQIELVTNFAAQAVIAVEMPAHELRQRTDDLSEFFTADRDRRRAQGHQPLTFDLQAVLNVWLELYCRNGNKQ